MILRFLLLVIVATQLPAQMSLPAAVPQAGAVFTKILCGEEWETTFVLLNMGQDPAPFHLFFFGTDGTLANSSLEGTLNPNSSVSRAACDANGDLREGWSLLTFDQTARVGGYATIRRRTRSADLGGDATIPLSNMEDFSAYVPFDNTQGFRTQLTLVNPVPNLDAQARLTYRNVAGDVVLIDVVLIKPGHQTTLTLPDTYPDLANKKGTVVIEANLNRFCATGLRYQLASGAIVGVPVMQ